jgi:hypothetical protein
MSTLWKRASGAQEWMLVIVAGAVLNASHAHPGRLPNRIFARSVAKRAVGTISAHMPELLAASRASVEPSGSRPVSNGLRRHRRLNRVGADRGRPQDTKAAPFTALCRKLGNRKWKLRNAGDFEALACLDRAISELAPMARRERGKPARRKT